jgi:integrase
MRHHHRRNGVFHFRLRLPQDLAARFKLKDIRFSLGTRDFREARRLTAIARTAIAWLVMDLRKILVNTEGEQELILTTSEIRQLARAYYERQVAHDAELRMHPGEYEVDLAALRAGRPAEEARLCEAINAGDVSATREEALDLIEAHRPEAADGQFDVTTVGLMELAHLLLRAKLAANRLAQARDRGDFGATTTDPLFAGTDGLPAHRTAAPLSGMLAELLGSPPREKPLSERQSMTLTQALPLVLKHKQFTREKTQGDYVNAITWLSQVVGDLPVGRVTDDHLLEFKETLVDTPKNFRKLLKTDNILEAIALNKKRTDPLPLLDRKTVNHKYLGAIRGFFAWAAENKYTVDKIDPAHNIRVSVKNNKGSSKKRLPFSPEQLQRMFDSTVYCGCKSPGRRFERGSKQIKDYRFWVPLIATFSGCRLNELGQMEISDIKNHYGMPSFFVRTQRDPEEEGDELDVSASEQERSVKSAAGYRIVPIHSELIKIGFLNYVKERARHGRNSVALPRLFPEWEMETDGYYSSKFSRWFNQQFLPKLKLKSRHHVFHSLRHSFKDAMRDSSITAETQHRVIGHSTGHVSEEYGSGTLTWAQGQEMKKFHYRGLNLAHLYIRGAISDLN